MEAPVILIEKRKPSREQDCCTIYELIGAPSFRPLLSLPASQIKTELVRLLKAASEQGVNLLIRGTYPPETLYKFLTEEFFFLHTESIRFPGMVRNYIYEDFYPNHVISVQDTCTSFIMTWIDKKCTVFTVDLTEVFVTHRGLIRSQHEVIRRIQEISKEYISLTCDDFHFTHTSFNWDEEDDTGTAHTEGWLCYHGSKHCGRLEKIEGAFKFYLTYENNRWEIFYFTFPGFSW